MNPKEALFCVLVALLTGLTGCRIMQETVAYKSTATIVPAEEEGTYLTEAKVIRLSTSHGKEQETLIFSPRLKFKVDEEAVIQASDEQEQTGVFVTVYVSVGGKKYSSEIRFCCAAPVHSCYWLYESFFLGNGTQAQYQTGYKKTGTS